MRIAHITPVFLPYKSGMSHAVFLQCRELARRGHDVTVIAPRSKGVAGFEEVSGIKVLRVKPLLWYSNAFLTPQLLWRLKKYDIVQLHYPFFGGTEWVLLAKKLGLMKKLIVYYHMDAHVWGVIGVMARWYERMIIPALLNATDRIAVSSLDYFEHSRLVKYFRDKNVIPGFDLESRNKHKKKFFLFSFLDSRFRGNDREAGRMSKVVEVPLGIDLKNFQFPISNFQLQALRNKLGVDEQGKMILFVGSMDKAHYFKGVDVLLKAFSALVHTVGLQSYRGLIQLSLVLVGDGNLLSNYQQCAHELKIENHIRFVGHISDKELPYYYHLSDIVVVPSINSTEAFGMVLLEAMACEKPVIASDLPGVRTLVAGGLNGYLVTPGDVQDLAQKLQIIFADEHTMQRMGKEELKKVEKYGADMMGDRLCESYGRA